METIKIKAAEGKHVRDPFTKQVLGFEPIVVEKTSYWYRRILDGSVILVDDAVTKAPAKAPSTPKGDK